MDSITRNALRLTLAGAGVAVLGAGFVGQASAAELPATPVAPEALTAESLTSTEALQEQFPSFEDFSPADSFGELPSADSLGELPSADSLGELPSADQPPSLDELPPLEIPGAMFLEAPTLS